MQAEGGRPTPAPPSASFPNEPRFPFPATGLPGSRGARARYHLGSATKPPARAPGPGNRYASSVRGVAMALGRKGA
jgi:hypothetical protein